MVSYHRGMRIVPMPVFWAQVWYPRLHFWFYSWCCYRFRRTLVICKIADVLGRSVVVWNSSVATMQEQNVFKGGLHIRKNNEQPVRLTMQVRTHV